MSSRSSCPECGTILRVRDRSFVGRRVQCPECKTALRVEAVERDGHFQMRRLTANEIETIKQGHASSQRSRSRVNSSNSGKRSKFHRIANSRMTVAFLLSIGVMALIAVLVLNPRIRVMPSRSPAITRQPDPVVDPVVDPSDVPPSPADSSHDQPPPVRPESESIEPVGDETLSAMEPANVEGGLAWSPPVFSETVSEVPIDRPQNVVPEKVDVEGKMSLKIVAYKQPKVTRKLLIEALEEQLGVPIRYDVAELGSEELEQKVAFELENTTVGDIIQTVAKEAGWQVITEDTGIRLAPKNAISEPESR